MPLLITWCVCLKLRQVFILGRKTIASTVETTPPTVYRLHGYKDRRDQSATTETGKKKVLNYNTKMSLSVTHTKKTCDSKFFRQERVYDYLYGECNIAYRWLYFEICYVSSLDDIN